MLFLLAFYCDAQPPFTCIDTKKPVWLRKKIKFPKKFFNLFQKSAEEKTISFALKNFLIGGYLPSRVFLVLAVFVLSIPLVVFFFYEHMVTDYIIQ